MSKNSLQILILKPDIACDYDTVYVCWLQYLGFCVWSLVEVEGALIPGNPNMGVCRWKGNYYALSSPAMAAEFGQGPDK
jgi:hypothetical protein